MNIVKLQKQLENVPDHALVGYVQNPNGQVPSYLALSELNRRKELRADYEKQKAPEKSVAEGMVEEASGIQALPQAPQGQPAPQQMAQAPQGQPAPQQMAEGGLAQLDLPDHMFNEAAYAAGGIVAFDDGGTVAFNRALLNSGVANAPGAGFRFAEDIANSIGNLSGDFIDSVTGLAWTTDPKTGKLIRKSDLRNQGKNEIINAAAHDVASQYKGNAAPASPTNPTGIGSVPIGSMTSALQANPSAEPNPLAALATRAPIPDTKLKSPPTPGAANAGNPPPRDPRMQTVSEIGYDLPKVDIRTIDVPEGIKTLDYINQQKQAMEQAGVDPNFYAKRAEEIKAQKEALTGDKEKAGWMALAKAGLGMAAGKSPFALQNIAEGAMSGMDQYGRDLKEFKADEKQLKSADDKLAEAQYLQSRGDAQGALAAMKERESLIFNTKAKNTELQNQGAIEESRQKSDRSKTMFTQKEEDRRAAAVNDINRMIATKSPAEVALVDKYMNDPKFATSYDKMNAGKKEAQSLQDMRELWIKAQKDNPSVYENMSWTDFLKQFSSTPATPAGPRKQPLGSILGI